MPDSDVQTTAPATGTSADKPLTAPVSETLGQKLDSLLFNALADEQPAQETTAPAEAEAPKAEAEETAEEKPSEEPTTEVEATEDTDLSQEPEENAESSESEEPAEDLPKGVKKRISKLAAAKRELEQRIKELEEKISQPQPTTEVVAPVPLPSNPYLHLDTQAKVEAEIQQARRVKRWAEENPDGTTVLDPKTGRETEYTAEKIREIKLNAMDALEEYLPKQLAYVQQRQQIDPLAEQTYSFWKDRSSAEYQQAQKMLQAFPELQKFPDFKMVVGDYIAGAKLRESLYAKQKSGQAAKPVIRKAPPQPTKPVSAPAPIKESDARAQQTDALMRKKPTQESLKKVLLSQFL